MREFCNRYRDTLWLWLLIYIPLSMFVDLCLKDTGRFWLDVFINVLLTWPIAEFVKALLCGPRRV